MSSYTARLLVINTKAPVAMPRTKRANREVDLGRLSQDMICMLQISTHLCARMESMDFTISTLHRSGTVGMHDEDAKWRGWAIAALEDRTTVSRQHPPRLVGYQNTWDVAMHLSRAMSRNERLFQTHS